MSWIKRILKIVGIYQVVIGANLMNSALSSSMFLEQWFAGVFIVFAGGFLFTTEEKEEVTEA